MLRTAVSHVAGSAVLNEAENMAPLVLSRSSVAWPGLVWFAKVRAAERLMTKSEMV